jgi:hypothetical protein
MADGRRRAECGWIVATFFVAIWLPLLGAVLERDAAISPTEQRRLAPLPRVPSDWQSLAGLPVRTSAYFDDRMGFRTLLIQWHARAKIGLLGVSPSDSLIVGREGWFYFGDPLAVAQYRGIADFSPADLDDWKRSLETTHDWLAERDIAYLVVFVPNKHSVYPEFMPARLPRRLERNQLSQLSNHLRTHSRVEVLDLYPPLLRAKARQRIYHRTDTHWNDVGAYEGYRLILIHLEALLPGFAPLEPVAVRAESSVGPGLGLARIVGLAPVYREEMSELHIVSPRARVAPRFAADYGVRVREQRPFAFATGDPSLPRAVVFRDSFANALIPYLSESFDRALYAWSRSVEPRIVDHEKPHVVIHQITERFLAEPPPTPAF